MDGLAIGQAVEDAVLQTLKNREITTVDTRQLNFNNWHQSYHDLTMDLMSSDPDVLYQPSFVYGTLFCKCDILVRNAEGTYDLREVKAKNSVRKKTKDAPLLDDMSADVSFQHYVLSKVLGEKYSGRCFFVHLNKEYVRQGEVDYHTLIHNDDVSEEVMTADHLEHLVTQLQEAVAMNKEELDTRYPYKGDDYLTYFGEQPPV